MVKFKCSCGEIVEGVNEHDAELAFDLHCYEKHPDDQKSITIEDREYDKGDFYSE